MCPLVLRESFFLRPEASRPEYWASQDLWVFHHTVGKTLGPSRCLARIVVFKPHHKQVFRHNYIHRLGDNSAETLTGQEAWMSVCDSIMAEHGSRVPTCWLLCFWAAQACHCVGSLQLCGMGVAIAGLELEKQVQSLTCLHSSFRTKACFWWVWFQNC